MSFSIFCNSINGTKVVVGTNNAVNYTFDFAVATQHTGKFKLGYSFLSQGGITLATTDILYLSTSLPVSMNNYLGNSSGGATKSSILGFINNNRQNASGTDCFYFKNYTDCSPVIIQQLPKGLQTFTVYLYNALTDALDTKITTNTYSLVLFFEAIED